MVKMMKDLFDDLLPKVNDEIKKKYKDYKRKSERLKPTEYGIKKAEYTKNIDSLKEKHAQQMREDFLKEYELEKQFKCGTLVLYRGYKLATVYKHRGVGYITEVLPDKIHQDWFLKMDRPFVYVKIMWGNGEITEEYAKVLKIISHKK